MYPIGYNYMQATNIINAYIDHQGYCPYSLWLDSVKDFKAKAAIISRIDRMELGLFGDSESIGEGVYELRIHFGPGYRVYYAKEELNIYLLLCGGNKSTQKKDIILAKNYWRLYKRQKNA